jgi:peroxiredoxin family protein
MVLFSGHFDRVFAAFIIASGALAMGKESSMFVTFWGFDAIKKPYIKTAGRRFLEKIVPWMRHKGTLKLGTSKINFGGIGSRFFCYMMSKKNVEPLSSLIEMLREVGNLWTPGGETKKKAWRVCLFFTGNTLPDINTAIRSLRHTTAYGIKGEQNTLFLFKPLRRE